VRWHTATWGEGDTRARAAAFTCRDSSPRRRAWPSSGVRRLSR